MPPTRIERATRGLGNRCSIQLSYGGAKEVSHTRTSRASLGHPWLSTVTLDILLEIQSAGNHQREDHHIDNREVESRTLRGITVLEARRSRMEKQEGYLRVASSRLQLSSASIRCPVEALGILPMQACNVSS